MALAEGSMREIGDPLEVFVALVTLHERAAWTRDAFCREHPSVNFFRSRGEATEPAKAVRARCLVRDECLAAALEMAANEIESAVGIRGGTSSKEQRRLRRVVLSGRGPPPWWAPPGRPTR